MRFSDVADPFFADFFRLYPAQATQAGNHAHDHRWPDLTDAGRGERLAFLADARARLEALGQPDLSRDEAVDRRVLLGEIDALRFDEEELDEAAWNPISYTYLFGGSLFALLSREFAPLADRLRSAAGRMETLPDAIAAARANLTSGRGRTVSRFHTEKAIETMPGVAELCRAAGSMAAELEDPELRARVERAAEQGAAAVEAFTTWLQDELLPQATGDFRLGRDLYERKFRHALKSDVTPDELEARAAAAYDEVRGEMLRIARELWPQLLAGEAMPDDGDATIRRVLDEIAREHPAADEMLEFCRAETARIAEFVRGRDLVGLPDDPLEIIWTPPFLRANAGAMLIAPGPLDRGVKSFFAITPAPDDWSAEQVESKMREDNSRSLRVLSIHEAIPGHYLQLAFANRCESLPRTVFGSGVFVEGWAVFVTQVMMDAGYGADDPALMLAHWKYFLRAITNTLMDIRIHAREPGMTEEEAMSLMVEGGFQEHSEAAEKWNRARLSSTQLCEYFLGFREMTELERQARRRVAGGGREFEWRPFLESVISHGMPPVPIVRDILSAGA